VVRAVIAALVILSAALIWAGSGEDVATEWACVPDWAQTPEEVVLTATFHTGDAELAAHLTDHPGQHCEAV
jgi:hypothetical protein